MLKPIQIIKETGTYAEALQAYGVAELIRSLMGESGAVRIVDEGHRFLVTGPEELDSERSVGKPLIYPYIALAKGAGKDMPGLVIEYAEEQERRKARTAAREAKQDKTSPPRGRRKAPRKAKLPTEIEEQVEDQMATNPDVDLVATLNMLDRQGTVKRGNELRETFARQQAGAVLKQLRTTTSGAEEETLGQAINPAAGKGTNRAKPDGASRCNLAGPALFEWLKFAGLYAHAFTHRITVGTKKDIEILVPVPTDIGPDVAATIMKQFRALWFPRANGVKYEVLAVLAYSKMLARFDPHLIRKGRPNKAVAAINVAYFKDLGGARQSPASTPWAFPDGSRFGTTKTSWTSCPASKSMKNAWEGWTRRSLTR